MTNHGKIWPIQLLTRSATLLLLLPASILAQETKATDQKLPASTFVSKQPNDKTKAPTISQRKATQVFSVTSGEKTAEHPFHSQGSKMGFAIDNVFGKELVLTRGETYIFDVDSRVKHDFYFSTQAKGWGAGTVTEGITGQFIYKGKIAFSPNELVPERIFYACRNHKYMGGLVHVINKGETVVMEGANLNIAIQTASNTVSEDEVKQKIAIAKIMVMGSAAQKVENSSDSSAKGLMNKAKINISTSESALKTGNNREALKIVTTALDHANAAINMVPEQGSIIDHSARHARLVDSFRVYKNSYEQQYSQAKKQGDSSFESHLSPNAFQKMDDDAVKLSTNGQYAEANKILAQAQEKVIAALTSAFDGKEIVYDKNFETAEQEFEYELARNQNFEQLVPLAIELRRPSEGAIKLINGYLKKGKQISSEAKDIARKGDHATAVLGLQESTRQFQRALASAGVR